MSQVHFEALGNEKGTGLKDTTETSGTQNLAGIVKPKTVFTHTPTSDLNTSQVLRSMSTRFWRLKNMYRQTSGFYFRLNLYLFYLPLLACGVVNTIVPAVMMNENNPNVNLIVTGVSAFATILTS